MGSIVPRMGIEPTFLAFQATVLTITPPRPLLSPPTRAYLSMQLLAWEVSADYFMFSLTLSSQRGFSQTHNIDTRNCLRNKSIFYICLLGLSDWNQGDSRLTCTDFTPLAWWIRPERGATVTPLTLVLKQKTHPYPSSVMCPAFVKVLGDSLINVSQAKRGNSPGRFT